MHNVHATMFSTLPLTRKPDGVQGVESEDVRALYLIILLVKAILFHIPRGFLWFSRIYSYLCTDLNYNCYHNKNYGKNR